MLFHLGDTFTASEIFRPHSNNQLYDSNINSQNYAGMLGSGLPGIYFLTLCFVYTVESSCIYAL